MIADRERGMVIEWNSPHITVQVAPAQWAARDFRWIDIVILYLDNIST